MSGKSDESHHNRQLSKWAADPQLLSRLASEIRQHSQPYPDLTTQGRGVDEDTRVLVYRAPKIVVQVPGHEWFGTVGSSQAVLRFPNPELWNGKLVIGATPAVRGSRSLDWLVSDLVLQRGYAYAASDKGTPGLILRDPNRQMTEWVENYEILTKAAQLVCGLIYDKSVTRTYVLGVSNGGYLTRRLLESTGDLFDGGVEWEGVFHHPDSHPLLESLSILLQNYPVFKNFRGDRTRAEQTAAQAAMIDAGLHPDSSPYWRTYYSVYWMVSLWLYGRNLDPGWKPFEQPWNNDWIKDPAVLASYPWSERKDLVRPRMERISNTGQLQKPMLSVAGNWDCLLPFPHHAEAYAQLVKSSGRAAYHRLYEIHGGNHVDGLLRTELGRQQPVLPYFEAAFHYVEDWVERSVEPPQSGFFQRIEEFYPHHRTDLYSLGKDE